MRKILTFFNAPIQLVNYLSPYNYQHYLMALRDDHVELIEEVLRSGVRIRNQDEENILMGALEHGNEEIVAMLVEKYGELLNFKRRNQKGDTPLMMAIFRKMAKVIELLIPVSQLQGCDFNKNTPFIAAAANGDIETLKLLIQAGCKCQVKNDDGQTALHRACFFGQTKTVDWLLKHTNLKIGQKDKKGNNCIHLACMGCNLALTRFLMQKVKDSKRLLVQNFEGKTPLFLVEEILKMINQGNNKKIKLSHLIND